jgi:ketosteroid isomerase-like protein
METAAMAFRMAMVLAGTLLLAASEHASGQGSGSTASSVEEKNRKVIAAAFERWASGDGDVFSLLTDDARWQIIGSDTEIARTYHSREELLAGAARPLAVRLTTPLKPSVRKIWADGEDVLVHWDGRAELFNGTTYRNSYLWIMTVKDDRVVAVTAFLDIPSFKAALALPAPAR